jgi:hypothetical protein
MLKISRYQMQEIELDSPGNVPQGYVEYTGAIKMSEWWVSSLLDNNILSLGDQVFLNGNTIAVLTEAKQSTLITSPSRLLVTNDELEGWTHGSRYVRSIVISRRKVEGILQETVIGEELWTKGAPDYRLRKTVGDNTSLSIACGTGLFPPIIHLGAEGWYGWTYNLPQDVLSTLDELDELPWTDGGPIFMG